MLISFEGVEGAGKSTQIRLLAARLREEEGRANVLVTREPGDGPLGRALRELVLTPPEGIELDPVAELLLMLADRAQHCSQTLRPALQQGIVLCDRFADSSLAYQGNGRGLDLGLIDQLNTVATGGLTPDATVLLDIAPAVGLARQTQRNRMENEDSAFHARVRAGYLELARAHPQRFLVINADRAPEAVHLEIWNQIAPRLHGETDPKL